MKNRITTTRRRSRGPYLAASARPATPAAADREPQQIMADCECFRRNAAVAGVERTLASVEAVNSVSRINIPNGRRSGWKGQGTRYPRPSSVREKWMRPSASRVASQDSKRWSALPERGAAPPRRTTRRMWPSPRRSAAAASAASTVSTGAGRGFGLSLVATSYGEYTRGNYYLAVRGSKLLSTSKEIPGSELRYTGALFLDRGSEVCRYTAS